MRAELSRRAVLLASVTVFASGGGFPARADDDPLRTLTDLIAARLALMPDVARHKYNSGAAVEDSPREAEVLAAVTAQAERAGVERGFAERFFQAQIDAAKMLQQARIDGWTAEKHGKFVDVPDLATGIRPRLDELTPRLIAALRAVAPELDKPEAGERLARAVADYAARQPQDAAVFRRALAPLGR